MLYLVPWAVGALAFLYKIWRILRKDRKEDSLDDTERLLREEMRNDIKALKEENKILKEENQKLHEELSALRASFKVCESNHPAICPIFRNIHDASNAHEIR